MDQNFDRMRRRWPQRQFDEEPDPIRLYDARRKLENDPERAVQELAFLASRGSIMSMIYLGEAFARGTGGEIDQEKAESWYKKAAASGSPIALHLLGRLYLKSDRAQEAVEAFKHAAEKDYAPSLYLLGRMYFWGRGVQRDSRCGAKMFRCAMKLGNLPAKGAMAKFLMSGEEGRLGVLRGVWLSISVRMETLFVLVTEGTGSERLRM